MPGCLPRPLQAQAVLENPFGLWRYHLHARIRSTIRTADDHTDDRCSPGDWTAAAQRAFTALGDQWAAGPGRDRSLLVGCLRQGLPLARDFRLDLGWLTEAAFAYVSDSVWEPLVQPVRTGPDGETTGVQTAADALAKLLSTLARRQHEHRGRTAQRLSAVIDTGQLPDELHEMAVYYAHHDLYDHLRKVARDDVLAHLENVQGSQRQTTIIALRSLFGRAKKNGTIFKNPTSRIRVGPREEGVIPPLDPGHMNGSVAAVTHPADRLILALAAVHAARSAAIRRLQLDDLDIGNRRLSIDGRTRPMDELTLHVAREWLEFRRRRQELGRRAGGIQPEVYDPKLDVDVTPLRDQDLAAAGFGTAA
ncbi:hypothetical protein [Streptomyces sp. NPDC001970]